MAQDMTMSDEILKLIDGYHRRANELHREENDE